MNVQENNVNQNPYKIVFSNIVCKIKVDGQGIYGLVIRLGKKSSKYSKKLPILNGSLQIQNSLEVPFDGKALSCESIRKEKCEIMLYRFRMNGERQSKELIGMASLAVGNELFQQQTKRLRLTNSNDKQAFVSCRVKIQLGEADILQIEDLSKISSFFIKSTQNSRINERENSFIWQEKNKKGSSNGLPTTESKRSLSSQSELMKQDNFLLRIFESHIIDQNRFNTKKVEKVVIRSQKQLDYRTQPSFGFKQVPKQNTQMQNENDQLLAVCTDLQKQNRTLINRIQALENQIFNQSLILNKSQNKPQIPRPAGSIRRSPMIKKNTSITVTPSFQKQQRQSIQMQSSTKQHQLTSQKSAGFLHHSKPSSQNKLNSPKQKQNFNSPYFSTKSENQTFQNQILFKVEQSQIMARMSFSGERVQKQNVKLSLNNVIGVVYKPPLAYRLPRHETSQIYRQNSFTNKSVSDADKRHSRSYSKFSGKKKYQAIGIIKSPNQSQNLSYLQDENNNHNKKGSNFNVPKNQSRQRSQKSPSKMIVQCESPFAILKDQQKSPKKDERTNVFLDFLNDDFKHQNSFGLNTNQFAEGPLQPKDLKQNIPIQKRNQLDVQCKSRVTLQELDIKTEQKYRKNQRALKIANMKILDQNIALKKQKKALEQMIEHKKQLSHQQFSKLKRQIDNLMKQVEINKNLKTEAESKMTQILERCKNLQEENSKLKKDMKDQKSKYEYYLKIGHLNDYKNKQKQQIKASQAQIAQKKSSIRLDSQIFNSNIDANRNSSAKKIPYYASSISVINNKEDSSKERKSSIQIKSLKKVDFISGDKNFDGIKLSSSFYQKKASQQTTKLNIPKVPSSYAVLKLKEQIRSCAQMKGEQSFQIISSPVNTSFSASKGPEYKSNFAGGLMGTGDTIVQGDPNVFSSFGRN